jgi:hypothetical protein
MHPGGLVLSRQPMQELTPPFIASKGYPHTALIPIVYCSGNDAAREPAMRLGAVDFLESPFEIVRPPERLGAVLAHRPTAKSTSSIKP